MLRDRLAFNLPTKVDFSGSDRLLPWCFSVLVVDYTQDVDKVVPLARRRQ
ncbi:hypothetical protein H6F83_00560 [Coleofasciculus sp. FACHB-125]|nr:hypothetical protein [Coleofasciculus sp. FACHB-125]MBD1898459.1 hypothetical protein [Coleofasciculus sp. FACHB-125]